MFSILVKVFIVGLAAVAISKSYIDYRKKYEPRIMFLGWTTVWVTATIFAIYPLLVDRLVSYTNDTTITVSSLLSTGFIFMLYIVYRVYTKAARIEHRQQELIRRLGLERGLKNSRK
jgi:hypothetical protein